MTEDQTNTDAAPDPDEERPELGPGDMKVLIHILLKIVKGIRVPQKVFDEYDRENIKMSRQYDPNDKSWNFFVPKKRKRSVIKPNRKLILPSQNRKEIVNSQ
jgi:hypothetical protein